MGIHCCKDKSEVLVASEPDNYIKIIMVILVLVIKIIMRIFSKHALRVGSAIIAVALATKAGHAYSKTVSQTRPRG